MGGTTKQGNMQRGSKTCISQYKVLGGQHTNVACTQLHKKYPENPPYLLNLKPRVKFCNARWYGMGAWGGGGGGGGAPLNRDICREAKRCV